MWGLGFQIGSPWSPENGEISHLRSDLSSFGGAISPFSKVGTGRGFCNFSLFFGDFRNGRLPGPPRGKTTRDASEGFNVELKISFL